MKEVLIKVNWWLASSKDITIFEAFEIFNDDITHEKIFIKFEGVTSESDSFVQQFELDLFREEDINIIKKYIKNLQEPKFVFNKESNLKTGELIMVFYIDSIQINNPEDPIEWDIKFECLGILGEQVKLKY